MAILSKGTTFATAQQVTSTNLNALVDSATFVAGASGTTDDSTLEVNGAGRLQMKDAGTTAAKLASNSVTAAKIVDGTITYAKLSTGAPIWNGTTSMTLTFADQSTTIVSENSESTGAKTPGFSAVNYTATFAGVPVMEMKQARGSKASPTALQSGDFLGAVRFLGHDGTDFETTAQILASASENFSGSQTGTVLRFQTNEAGSTTLSEQMRISETGGLLIGATTDVPSAALALGGTDKGLRLNVLTTAQRDAISSPAEGLLIFNTTTNKLNFYTGAAWEAVTSA